MSSHSKPQPEDALSLASHNLNARIRQVRCYSQLLREESASLEPHSLEHIARIEEGAERLQELVSGLFPLLRLKRESLKFEDVNLTLAVQRSAVEMAERIQKAGATLAHDPMPKIHGDREIITKVMQHLIDNGIKFNRSAAPRVHISGTARKGTLTVAVEDNGIGVAPEYLERCFTPFTKLHSETEFPGQGLSLAFCKKAIEFQKGRIWMESTPGEGTTIRFTLRLAEA